MTDQKNAIPLFFAIHKNSPLLTDPNGMIVCEVWREMSAPTVLEAVNNHNRLVAEVAQLREALTQAIKVAAEAREEWDKAPSGMNAGKLLIALSGDLSGYRADIDTIHAALASQEQL